MLSSRVCVFVGSERDARLAARAAAKANHSRRANNNDDDDGDDLPIDDDDNDGDFDDDELSSGEKELLTKIRDKKKLQSQVKHRKSSVRNQQAVLPRRSG